MDTKIDKITTSPLTNLALQTIKQQKQALIFTPTKLSSEKTAEEIAKKIQTTNEQLKTLTKQIETTLTPPTKQCQRLAKCTEKGIAFHHAGLTSKQKNLIETQFKQGIIKIICCTPTLAAGLDLPAYRVIIKTLKRYGKQGYQHIPVLEYLQMAGRAGRPKYDKEGQAIIIAKDQKEKQELYEKYILGKPENLYSKLAVEPVLRTYTLSLIATNFVNNTNELINFFKKTFWAHQYQNLKQIEKTLNKIINQLQEWNLLQNTNEGFQQATKQTNQLKATKLGIRTAELYIDPLTANQLIKATKPTNDTLTQLQLITNCLEMKPLPTIKTNEEENIELTLEENRNKFLTKEPQYYDPNYDEYLKTIKTALIIKDWINETTEDHILTKYGIKPGELKTKLERAEWLTYSWGELAKTQNQKETLKQTIKLKIRIKNGVKEELIPLLKLKGIGRIRARKLHNNNIKTINQLKKTNQNLIAKLIGTKIAQDIKKQLNQKETTQTIL